MEAIDKIKLHLGCGEVYLEGYINIDLPRSEHNIMKVKADVYKDIRQLEYPENFVDEIRTHHMLEHFSRQEAIKILFQWRRWLKVGGVLHVETPDFETAAKKFSEADLSDKFKIARHIFGSHESSWAFHRDFWGEEKFRFVLNKLGFEIIEIKPTTAYTAKYIPDRFSKYASKILPSHVDFLDNITARARKTAALINKQEVAKEILEMSRIGKEDDILNVWLKEVA